jgi:hypothetical protein
MCSCFPTTRRALKLRHITYGQREFKMLVIVAVAPVQRTVRAAASGAFAGAERTGFFYDLHGTRIAAFSPCCQDVMWEADTPLLRPHGTR